MTTPLPSTYLPLFLEALNHEIGICVMVNDPVALRKVLYQARADANDLRLQEITIFLPSTNDRVFLARKGVELDA